MKLIFFKTRIAGILIAIIWSSCNEVPTISNRKEVAQEMQDRKIKRVTENDLLNWVKRVGAQIGYACNEELLNALNSKPDNHSFNLGQWLQKSKLIKRDSLEDHFRVRIEFIDLSEATQLKHPSAKATEVLQAYAYQAKQADQTLQANLQKNNKNADTLFYTYPSYNYKYPELTKKLLLPEVLGVWLITFTKKESIRKIDMKQLLKEKNL